MTAQRVNIGSWLIRVRTWDATLPAVVAVVPALLGRIFPDRRWVLELTAVTLPVAAFLFRLWSGRRHIESNHCSKGMQRIQLYVFRIGILPLVLFECFLILQALMPKGPMPDTWTDDLVCGIFVSVYLLSMTFAMYPGPTPSHAARGWTRGSEIQPRADPR